MTSIMQQNFTKSAKLNFVLSDIILECMPRKKNNMVQYNMWTNKNNRSWLSGDVKNFANFRAHSIFDLKKTAELAAKFIPFISSLWKVLLL